MGLPQIRNTFKKGYEPPIAHIVSARGSSSYVYSEEHLTAITTDYDLNGWDYYVMRLDKVVTDHGQYAEARTGDDQTSG